MQAAEATSRTTRAAPPLWMACIILGLGSGFLEIAVILVDRLWRGAYPLIDRYAIWMTPLMTLTMVAVAGLVLTLLPLIIPAKIANPVSLFSLACIGFYGPASRVPRLHWIAAAALAAGLAVQTTTILRRRHTRNARSMQFLAAGFVALIILCASADWTVRQFNRQRQLSSLTVPPANAPNVLLIVMDTVRAQNLSLYGYHRRTSPTLQELAGQGVLFKAAFATAPWTLPSHASIFTGRLPSELSAGWTAPLDAEYPTLAEAMKDSGYVTAAFVSNLIYGTVKHGLQRGFIDYHGVRRSLGQMAMSSSLSMTIATNARLRMLLDYYWVLNRPTAASTTEEFTDWLAGNGDKPFFAFLNYMDAHEPYMSPAPYYSRFGMTGQRHQFNYTAVDAFRPSKWTMSPEQRGVEIAAYDGAIAYIDAQIAEVVKALEDRGLLSNTILIITADHGEHFGEHGLYGHGNSLYREVLEVPLLIRFGSGVPQNLVVEEPISLRDLPATVMKLIGAEPQNPFPGVSLTRFWDSTAASTVVDESPLISQASRRTFGVQQPWYPLNKGDMQSVIYDGYHFIANENGMEELYRLESDPTESHNLATIPEVTETLQTFRELLNVSE